MYTRKRNRIPLNFVKKKRNKLNVSKEIVDVVMPSQQLVEQDNENSQCDVDDDCYDVGDTDIVTVEGETSVSSHIKRIMKVDEKWEEVNLRVYRTIIEGFSFGSFPCIICGNLAQVRCLQCGSLARYCLDCGVKRHSMINFHHYPELWQDDHFVALKLPIPDIRIHKCGNKIIDRLVTCFDVEGVPRTINVGFCGCEPDAVSLVKLNYWPATPSRPSIAFSFAMLDWLEALLLECQVPVQDFVYAMEFLLKNRCGKMPCKIYPVLIGSFEEYRAMKNRLRQMDGIISNVAKYYTSCPACPKDGGILTVSIDANFGLCRKKSAGSSVYKPKTRNLVFQDQQVVDDFVLNYKSSSKDKCCSDFLAGNMLRSKTRYAALEETAVMGCACRHECPIPCFINLKHGERIAYAVFICEKLRQLFPGHKIQCMYDIACNLDSHLKARGNLFVLEEMKFAIPVFHAYGHKSSCQLKYSPRNIPGFGLSDGEVVERLWSYLRRFAAMTKEMHSSHRIDILSDALMYYCMKSSSNLSKLLPKRLTRTKKVLQDSQIELEELIKKYPEYSDKNDLLKWVEEEKALHCQREVQDPHDKKEMDNLARERWFLLKLKSKYAAGQAIAIHLSRRITVVTKQLKSSVEKYNVAHPTSKVTWEDVVKFNACDQSFPKHQAVRLLQKIQRAEEEEHRLLEDMKNTIFHYTDLRAALSASLTAKRSLESPSDYDWGAIALISAKIQKVDQELELLHSFPQFDIYTSDIPIQHDYCEEDKEEEEMGEEDNLEEDMQGEMECLEDFYSEIEGEDMDDSYSEVEDCDNGSFSFRVLPSGAEGFSPNHQTSHIDKYTDDVSSSSGEELEIQTWRINKLLREDYLQSIKRPEKEIFNKEDLQLIEELDKQASQNEHSKKTSGVIVRRRQ